MTGLAGTAALLRLALRRDRLTASAWLAVLLLVAAGSAASTGRLYPTVAARALFAAGVAGNPTTITLYGPGYDLRTVGGAATWKTAVLGAVLVWLLCAFTVVRHTRAEEQAGRTELLRAGGVGRLASLTAAVLDAALIAVAAGVVIAVGLVATGVPAGGAMRFGLSLTGVGWCAAVVAAVCAQLTESSRAANGSAAAVLAVAYALRAAGDARHDVLAWFSPLGWVVRLRPFGATRWWAFALIAFWMLVLGGLAYRLAARRDLGAGLVRPRSGPAAAGPGVAGLLGLAWRLQRAGLLGWSVGFAAAGLAAGSVASGVGNLTGGSAATADLLRRLGGGHELVQSYLVATLGILGLVASAYAVQSVLRLRTEEIAQRADPVLVASGSRTSFAIGHLLLALTGTLLLMLVAGVAAGLAYGISVHDVGGQLAALTGAALVQVPAAWVLAGIALALWGLLPRAALAAWAVLVAFVLLGQLGDLLRLGREVRDLSPYTHVPHLPGGRLDAVPLLWLVLATAALVGAGLLGLRRRDIG